ncbi:TPA: hypothetical protein N0F65_006489 [Lagenidium giganteum]|uniref:Uncharacterized protein n=1 Tax=Lagenidium giganteum TaxID=4803 RepID=A0AAV2YT25_9STRA|nr:TPA: hypothetical protein N0F65_006489 [Lagenidium giganteum]
MASCTNFSSARSVLGGPNTS